MNLIQCDGNWFAVPGDGYSMLACSGQLVPVTPDQVAAETSLTQEEANLLLESTITLFVSVFVFLVMRKVLPR